MKTEHVSTPPRLCVSIPSLAVFAAALLALFLLAFGRSAHAATEGLDIDRVVALSGGRNIALRCRGRGAFTVLLETGDGGRRSHMARLFSMLSRTYRVCEYDRRNVGLSSSAPTPRKAAELAADLFDTLAATGERRPFLLFGTSMGGLLVRSYAATHEIAGFVTSNQPLTTGEIKKWVHPSMSASDRTADAAWAAGENNEHIDVNDVSHTIDDAPGPSVPYIILVSTERFQCPAAGACGPAYRAFLAASRWVASAGPDGKFRVIDGDHDLYVTHLDKVVAAINEVAALARPKSGSGSTAR